MKLKVFFFIILIIAISFLIYFTFITKAPETYAQEIFPSISSLQIERENIHKRPSLHDIPRRRDINKIKPVPTLKHFERLLPYYQSKNILDSSKIAWGLGWENYQSNYGGSEFKFSFTNSKEITFTASSKNNEYGQGISIYVDDKLYILETPDIDKKELSIAVENVNGFHQIRGRHFCSDSYSPCDLSIKSIIIDSLGRLLPPPRLPSKTMAILGDSISVNWGRWNFSFEASDKLRYQLHNAGTFGSTVSQKPNYDWALERYKKDIIDYKPDFHCLFGNK